MPIGASPLRPPIPEGMIFSRAMSLSEDVLMSQHARSFLPAVGVMMLLLAPAPASAQGATGDWSHIIRTRGCHPDSPCPPREGMLWDPTNITPTYPGAMKAVGVGGETVLTFQVRADGLVDSSSVAVVRTSNQAFVRTSIAAIRAWRFGVEAEGRPAGSMPVQVHLIFSHQGVCQGSPQTQPIGWAAANQLVIGACVVQIPKSQERRTG